jgi:hypothetical protein
VPLSDSGRLAQAVACGLIFYGGAVEFINRHYQSRFGNVRGRRSFPVPDPITVVMPGFALDLSLTLGGRGRPSVAAVLLGVSALWIVVRDWPWRSYHLGTVVACVAAIAASAAAPAVAPAAGDVIDPQRANALLNAYFVVGMSLLVTGLVDHRLLATTLPCMEEGHADAI